MMLNKSICRQWWCLHSHVRSLKSITTSGGVKKYPNQFQWTSKAAGKDSDNSFLMPCIFYSDRNLFKNILFPFFSCTSARTNSVRGVSATWKCFYFYYRRAREEESQPPLCGAIGEICKLSAFVIFLTFFILKTVKNLFLDETSSCGRGESFRMNFWFKSWMEKRERRDNKKKRQEVDVYAVGFVREIME